MGQAKRVRAPLVGSSSCSALAAYAIKDKSPWPACALQATSRNLSVPRTALTTYYTLPASSNAVFCKVSLG